MTLLDDYLNPAGRPGDFGGEHWSSFTAALRDARNVSGRAEATGEVTSEPGARAWIGAVAWLCFFDQIGTAVERVDSDRSRIERARLAPLRGRVSGGPFRRALLQFGGDLRPGDDATLYALRCSLAHNYSLVNPSPSNPDLRRHFVLFSTERDPVTLPPMNSDGSWWVNLRALGDLGETMAMNVHAAQRRGALRPRLHEQEFRARFFMWQGEAR
jgi:hypothetical protein